MLKDKAVWFTTLDILKSIDYDGILRFIKFYGIVLFSMIMASEATLSIVNDSISSLFIASVICLGLLIGDYGYNNCYEVKCKAKSG